MGIGLAVYKNDRGTVVSIKGSIKEIGPLPALRHFSEVNTVSQRIDKLGSHKKTEQSSNFERLFHITKKLLSTLKSKEVLEEFIKALSDFYTDATPTLLLTHEDDQYNDLPVSYFVWDTKIKNKAAFYAYQKGTIQIEEKDGMHKLYIPLKGTQAMYGVLQLLFPDKKAMTGIDFEILQHLADVFGNAFEKAKLHEQIYKRMNDLHLLNETSQTLNSNLRLSDTVQYMTEKITSSFQAEEIGFFFYNREGKIELLKGSTEYFFSDCGMEIVSVINEKIKVRKEAFMITDLKAEYEKANYCSVLVVPMIHNEELKGAVIVLHTKPYFFTYEQFQLLQSLINHFTLAFINSMLHEEMEELAITDHLTKLYSRLYLNEKIHESMRKDKAGTFILLDIDNFKKINDTYGHLVGDEIIIQVANLILKNKRKTDIAARWGGEELALYLPSVELEHGIKVAERLVKVVRESTNPPVTISGGVSCWSVDNPDDTADKLFNRADQALYEAKRTGKNRVVVYR